MFDMLILTMFLKSIIVYLVNCAYDPREGVFLSGFVDAKAGEVYVA